jgi:hypothetical protein
MGRRIRDGRPSPAIIVAALALVAALAGTAVAGPQATSSAINKKKVKKIARKQANKAIDAALPVGGDGIADGAVGRGKIAASAVGPSALGDIVVRRGQEPLNDGSNAIPSASCLPGERLISGGGATNRSNAPDISMNSSDPENANGTGVGTGEPISPPGRWSVEFVNAPGGVGDSIAVAFALCLR